MRDEAIPAGIEEVADGAAYHTRALDDMPNCVLVIGAHGTIVYANDAAREAMEIGEYVGRSFAEYFMVFPNSANDKFYEAILDAIREKRMRHQGRFLYVSPNGRRHAFFLTSSYLEGPGEDSYLVITCTDVTAEERAARLRRESTFLLVSTIVYICAFMFVYTVWDYLGRPFAATHLTTMLEVGGLVLGLLALRFTSLRLASLGLGTRNLGRNLREAGLASLALVGVLVACKLVLMRAAPALLAHPEALCSLSWLGAGSFVGCAFSACVQQFLTRGIVHQSLWHVLGDEHDHALAIAVSTVMLASLQMPYGPVRMLGSAVLLTAFGFLYERQRSIWGLVLMHFVLGVSAMALGLA